MLDIRFNRNGRDRMSSLFGLIGERLEHSFSPIIHSIIFKEMNLEGYYHLFEVDRQDLKRAVLGLNALGARGVNVTIPYKVEIMKYVHDISHEAEKIGAINTLSFKENNILGYNTDYFGFGIMLDKFKVDVKNREAVILGTGGAAKSVLQYLLDNNIRDVTIVSRDINAKREKFLDYRVISYDDIKRIGQQDIIINITPCGMYPKTNDSPVNGEDISKFNTAIDLIYNPMETLFLKHAKSYGLKVLNGLYMLVGQAIKAQELWNDVEINEEIIDSIYSRTLQNIKKIVG